MAFLVEKGGSAFTNLTLFHQEGKDRGNKGEVDDVIGHLLW